MPSKASPFLHPGAFSTADSLAIIHLKRDHQIPTILKSRDEDDEGYDEGKVVNTRFGSFPHSTLLGLPWGSQVRASKVDTGSRGRRAKKNEKRKREDSEAQDSEQLDGMKEAVTASSGFIHLLAPTPENWTSSLPHRTQVVYTPDYSYILHRIRARPGTNIIEAGAGSGSFTHASARAVYNGFIFGDANPPSKKRKLGKVWSYEFHEQRHAKLEKEITDHGLQGLVEITHRDVCKDGFLVGLNADESPQVDAIFLDLPAPWLALPHLTRQAPQSDMPAATEKFRSPLNPETPVHICTFSPCIEQVQRTVSTLRQLGWVSISMVEISQKRLEIRRERIGIENGLQRGVQATAANVQEAVSRLKELEGRHQSFHNGDDDEEEVEEKKNRKKQKQNGQNPNSKEKIMKSLMEKKIYKEGRLTHRPEGELKTHTSYLVFAVLPQEWTTDQEEATRAKWPLKKKEMPAIGEETSQERGKLISKRQLKREARQAQKGKDTNGMDDKMTDARLEEMPWKVVEGGLNSEDMNITASLGGL